MSWYYRLTNDYNGSVWALDVDKDSSSGESDLHIAKTGDFSGQYWKFVPAGNDQWHLRTLFRGDGYSLDVKNDGTNDQLVMAQTGDNSGQFWNLQKVEGSGNTWKLWNNFTGSEKFLDVYSDRMKPRMAGGSTNGMHWTLTVISTA